MSDKKKGKGFLRLLSPLRAAQQSKARQIDRPTITLRVADYGSILIQTTDEAYQGIEVENRPEARSASSNGRSRDASTPASSSSAPTLPVAARATSTPDESIGPPPADQRPELQLSGTVEITMPPHLGQRRVRAIRVGLSAKTKLHMGPGRGWEEDEIFHRKMEMTGDGGEGVVLDSGTQTFAFTLFIPDTIPVHDWLPTAVCGLTLYAEVEGLDPLPLPTTSGPIPRQRTSSRSASRHRSAPTSLPGSGKATPANGSRSGSPNRQQTSKSESRSRSRLPSRQTSLASPEYGQGLGSLMERLEGMDMGQRPLHSPEAVTPPHPFVDLQTVPWWHGSAREGVPFEILYNPNPAGGVTELNLRLMGEQEGLGGYRIDLTSQIWTVSAPLVTKLSIPVPPWTTTIYAMRVLLSQTSKVYSPRDPAGTPPITNTRVFSISEAGSIPPKGASGDGLPSLWRGPDAGGKDVEELQLETSGWLPSDDACRPSSVSQ